MSKTPKVFWGVYVQPERATLMVDGDTPGLPRVVTVVHAWPPKMLHDGYDLAAAFPAAERALVDSVAPFPEAIVIGRAPKGLKSVTRGTARVTLRHVSFMTGIWLSMCRRFSSVVRTVEVGFARDHVGPLPRGPENEVTAWALAQWARKVEPIRPEQLQHGGISSVAWEAKT